MVTHTWSNLFLHLVSALVADALGKNEYRGVAKRLSKGDAAIMSLKQELSLEGKLSQTYWICAFCVNQHTCICHTLGEVPTNGLEFLVWDERRRDTVTGRIFDTCECKRPKLVGSSPECECNKFDDMMAFLNREIEDFQQVVAVDPDFDL